MDTGDMLKWITLAFLFSYGLSEFSCPQVAELNSFAKLNCSYFNASFVNYNFQGTGKTVAYCNDEDCHSRSSGYDATFLSMNQSILEILNVMMADDGTWICQANSALQCKLVLSRHWKKWNELEKGAVIKYLLRKGMSPKEIHKDMVDTLGDDSLGYSTVKKWLAEFKRERESLEDDARSCRPRSSTSDVQVEAVNNMVLGDRPFNPLLKHWVSCLVQCRQF